MRVIAGRLRGRALKAPRGDATRPTSDRVREALFSILGDVSDLRVLDLYAGSGAIGIEAWSRGAGCVVLVESGRNAIHCIRDNLGQLGIERGVTLLPARVERSLERLVALGPFDLVYCDPPWGQLDRSVAGLATLLESPIAAEGATLVVEHPSRTDGLNWPPRLGQMSDRRVYGDTALAIFRDFARS